MIVELKCRVTHIADSVIWKWIITQTIIPRIVSFVKNDETITLYIMALKSEAYEGKELERLIDDLTLSLNEHLESQYGLV